MKRFENAQVGDEVYSMIHGDCFVIGKGLDLIYIKSKEKEFSDMSYSLTGSYFFDIGEPIIFYRKGSEKYLTERPETAEVDWGNVEEGVKIKSRDYGYDWEPGYFYKYDKKLALPFLVMNYAGFIDNCRFCKLAEPCKPEWIKNVKK